MQKEKNMENSLEYDKKSFRRFILLSLIGVIMFLLPVKSDGSFTVVTGLMSEHVIALLGDKILWFAVALIVVCGILQPVASIFKPKWIVENETLAGWFITTPVYWISGIFGAVVAVMCLVGKGPECIISEATGQTMVGILYPLVAIIFCIVFFVPFLTDFGLMEFVGVFLRKITKPLFTLPGRSAINLITSWLSASNAAVIITGEQYSKGYYTKREAAIIITAFSAVNIPFCLVIAVTLGVKDYFLQMYLTVVLAGLITAIITPRIPPLSKFPDSYNPETGKRAHELIPEGIKPIRYACKMAADCATNFSIKEILKSGVRMMFTVYIGTLPIVMAWGTLALILTEYTPIFDWISYPFGLLFDVLGVENAYEAAPAAISGFIDMYIPALMVINVPSMVTKWIIGTLSLAQIIFMTEVGILAIQAKVGLNVWNLFVIFLERTVISIPVIVLMANLFF